MWRSLSIRAVLVASALGVALLPGCVPDGSTTVPGNSPAVIAQTDAAAPREPADKLLLLTSLERAAAADDKDKWVTLKGQVVWAGGDPPKAEVLNVNKDETHCKSKGDVLGEKWVVNPKNKGIRWVVVYLMPEPAKEGEKQTPLPIHPDLKKVAEKDREVVIDQPSCKIEPHVVSLRAGEQDLVIKNSSPIPHNAKYAGIKNPGGNPLIQPGGKYVADDLKPSDFAVKMDCSIHGWMQAYIYVFNHPYHAVTNEDGKFEIKLAPAGKWRLAVWQESLGWKTGDKLGEEIVLEAGKDKEMNIELKPKE